MIAYFVNPPHDYFRFIFLADPASLDLAIIATKNKDNYDCDDDAVQQMFVRL